MELEDISKAMLDTLGTVMTPEYIEAKLVEFKARVHARVS